jgi:hypothetical protein
MTYILGTIKTELAEARRLLRAAFPKGIQVGDKLMDAAEYAPELCDWRYRKGRWPTVDEVCAGIKDTGGYALTAKGRVAPRNHGNIPVRLIWTNPDTN